MEINNFPLPNMYYRGNQRKSKKNPDEHSEEITSGFEDNSSLIDIRV
jgi:hypothetical protein